MSGLSSLSAFYALTGAASLPQAYETDSGLSFGSLTYADRPLTPYSPVTEAPS